MLDKRNIGLVIGVVFIVGSVAVPVRAQQMRHHGGGGSQVASVYSQLQALNAQRRSVWQSLQQTPTR